MEPAAGKVAHEPAGKRVARAGWIVNVLERIPRCKEDEISREENRAVLALLDDDHVRTVLLNPARRAQQVVIAGQLARFGVIYQQQIDALQQT